MRQWFKVLCLPMTVVGATSLATPVFAQTADIAASLAVDGVKLGMTKSEAIAAIQAADPGFLVKNFSGGSNNNIGYSIWTSNLGFTATSPDLVQLNNDWTALQATCEKPGVADEMSCLDLHGLQRKDLNNPKVIAVWFSPVPGQEKVIAVSSATTFVKSIPTTDAVKSVLLKKYPMQISSSTTDPDNLFGEKIAWEFDTRGRLIAPDGNGVEPANVTTQTAASYTCSIGGDMNIDLQLCPAPILPGSTNNGDHVRLMAWIQQGTWLNTKSQRAFSSQEAVSPANALLSPEVQIVLFDSSELYKFNAEAAAYNQNLQNQSSQSQAAKAQGGTPNF